MTPMPPHVFTVQSQYQKLMLTVELTLRSYGHSLNPNTGLMLAFVGNDPQSMTDMIKKGYCQGLNPSYSIRCLEQGGYIVRDPVRSDKRKKIIVLTPKGKELADQIRRALGGEAKREAA